MVYIDLIGTYSKYIRQNCPGGAIIKNNFSLICITTIDPEIGWFKIVEVPMFGLDEVTGVNDEYIDKSSYIVSQLFNNTCIRRCPGPRKVVFDNGYDF